MKKKSKLLIAATSLLIVASVTLFRFSAYADEIIPVTDLDDEQHVLCRGSLERFCIYQDFSFCNFKLELNGYYYIPCEFENFRPV